MTDPSRMCEQCPDDLCRCAHPRASHYEYILNGRDQGRCRDCDPTAGLPPGLYEAQSDTYAAAMMVAADHWFETALPDDLSNVEQHRLGRLE